MKLKDKDTVLLVLSTGSYMILLEALQGIKYPSIELARLTRDVIGQSESSHNVELVQ